MTIGMPHRSFGKDKPGRETLYLGGLHDIGELGRHHILLVLVRVKSSIVPQPTAHAVAKPHRYGTRVADSSRVCGLAHGGKANHRLSPGVISLGPLMITRGGPGCSPHGLPRDTAARYPSVIPRSSRRSRMVWARFRVAGRWRRPMGSFSIAGITLMAI